MCLCIFNSFLSVVLKYIAAYKPQFKQQLKLKQHYRRNTLTSSYTLQLYPGITSVMQTGAETRPSNSFNLNLRKAYKLLIQTVPI